MRRALVPILLVLACSSKPDGGHHSSSSGDAGAGGEPVVEGGGGGTSAGTNGQAAGQGGAAEPLGGAGGAAGEPSSGGGSAPVCQTIGAPIAFGECPTVERLECGPELERTFKVGGEYFTCSDPDPKACPGLQVRCGVLDNCQPTGTPTTSFAHCLKITALTCDPNQTPAFTTELSKDVFGPCATVDDCARLKTFCAD